MCKSADLLLMVLDATKPWSHKEILTRELEAVGMRLNRDPPNIYFRRKKTGGCGEGVGRCGASLSVCAGGQAGVEKVWASLCSCGPRFAGGAGSSFMQPCRATKSLASLSCLTLQVASASTALCSSPTWMTR